MDLSMPGFPGIARDNKKNWHMSASQQNSEEKIRIT